MRYATSVADFSSFSMSCNIFLEHVNLATDEKETQVKTWICERLLEQNRTIFLQKEIA
jgi:hypothetical protein